MVLLARTRVEPARVSRDDPSPCPAIRDGAWQYGASRAMRNRAYAYVRRGEGKKPKRECSDNAEAKK